MPATYTYPGLYIQEIPSGVRTITGVSTSDTAFVDYFARGPLNEPVRITSYGDFQRQFGGLHEWSEASYAIQQYYLNGGQVAWVVRVDAGDAALNPATARAGLPGLSPVEQLLVVEAANPGQWGNNLRVAAVAPPPTSPPAQPGRFTLVVREVVTTGGRTQVVNTETFRNLTLIPTDTRYAPKVVNAESQLVQVTVPNVVSPPALPTTGTATATGDAPDAAFRPLLGGSDGDLRDADGILRNRNAFFQGILGSEAAKSGMRALDGIEPFVFNLLCLPALWTPWTAAEAAALAAPLTTAATYCEEKRAFLLVDTPPNVDTQTEVLAWIAGTDAARHRNAAAYYPRLEVSDPLNEGRPRNVGASGTMAGIYARTDSTRGVWKAPAGTDAGLRGASIPVKLTDGETGALNPLGVNVLRTFPIYGNVAWGARTLEGADQAASEWKYVPVRRTALYIEESLFEGLKWVVFEPNDEPLWAQIRLNAGAFMNTLFRQGAFQGRTPSEAYFVKCDSETTTQNDIDRGVVNIVVGFAPLKPAEFVVIQIQQIAGQIQV